jgi:hypothetical protein
VRREWPRGRARLGLVVLVVAALAVVVGIAVAQRGGGDTEATADQGRGPVILSIEGVVTRPDGTTVDTGVQVGVGGFGVLEDRRVVVEAGADGARPREIRVYDADGDLEQTHPSAPEGMLATSAAVAWAGADGRLRVLRTGEREPLVLAASPKPERDVVKGLYGYELVAVRCDGPAPGCAVVTYYDARSTTLPPGIRRSVSVRVTAGGWEPLARAGPPARPPVESPDGTNRLVAQSDGCVSLVERATGDEVARTCDVSSLSWSPSGEHLVGISEDGIRVLDRRLEPVRTIPRPPGAVDLDRAWADDDSLLLVVMGEDEVVPDPAPGGDRPGGLYDWRLLDVPIDGSEPTVREGPVQGPHFDTNQWQWRLHDG